MNVAIYARFSSSSQREASIEEQVKICKEYATRNQCAVVKVYSDSALTGKNDNRPALRKLLADSSKKLFEVVLVYSIDRFGRNLSQTLQDESKLNENGVILLSATESFTNDPSGRFFRNLMMAHQSFSDIWWTSPSISWNCRGKSQPQPRKRSLTSSTAWSAAAWCIGRSFRKIRPKQCTPRPPSARA